MNDTKTKSYFWIFLNVFIVGLVICLFFFVMPLLANVGQSRFPARTFTVAAEGKINVKPDLAQFSFSVVTDGADLVKVAADNNKRLADAIAFVKKEGIDEEDIKTTQYSLNPQYEYNENSRRSFIVGYSLTQTVEVKVKNLEENLQKVSNVLGSLPELGVNQVSSLSFTVENPEEFMAEARKQAFEKAKVKAKAMVSAMGVGLGDVVSFYESGMPIPYYSKMGMGGDAVGAPSAAPIMSLEPGTEELVVNINVTYEIR